MTMSFDEVKDSGKRQQWDTGSQRDTQEGKGRWDLIPFLPMERLAQHFENGARKYDDDNWKKGQNLRQYVNSMMRHAFKLSEGWQDEDHAAAIMWNAAAFIWTADAIERGVLPAELDDIPGGFAAPGVRAKNESEETLDALLAATRMNLPLGPPMPVETPVYSPSGEQSVAEYPQMSTGEGLEGGVDIDAEIAALPEIVKRPPLHNPESDAPK